VAPAAELFHRIGDPDSAEARRRASALGLIGRVAFRNVHFESHARALAERGGGGDTPAFWDGTALHQGLEAVLAALERLAGR
jgi:hypothetical protein